jgi:hypothetical protein
VDKDENLSETFSAKNGDSKHEYLQGQFLGGAMFVQSEAAECKKPNVEMLTRHILDVTQNFRHDTKFKARHKTFDMTQNFRCDTKFLT